MLSHVSNISGILQVVSFKLGSMVATGQNFGQESVTWNFSVGEERAEMLNVVTEWRGDWCDSPAMPEMLTVLEDRGIELSAQIQRVDEAESVRPHTFTFDPSGACTRNWHIIRRALDAKPAAALLEMEGWTATGVDCSCWELPLASLWMSMWCGFWHFLDRLLLTQWLEKWPGLTVHTQFIVSDRLEVEPWNKDKHIKGAFLAYTRCNQE